VPFTYPYPRPAVTVDVVLFTMRADDLAVLLVQRAHDPFKCAWALPGGFVDENEPLEKAARRELEEETGVTRVALEQLGAYGDPGRDPRGHTVSVAYVGFAVAEAHPVKAGDDAANAAWHGLRSLSRRGRGAVKLAFDHATIIARARQRLRAALRDPMAHPIVRDLVPPRFTLRELQRVYEAVLGRKVGDRDFRAYLRRCDLVEPVGGARSKGARGAQQLYRWKRSRASSW